MKRFSLRTLEQADAKIAEMRDDEIRSAHAVYQQRMERTAEIRRVAAIIDAILPTEGVSVTGSDTYSYQPFISIRFGSIYKNRAVFTKAMADLRREIGPMRVSYRQVVDPRKKLVEVSMCFTDEKLGGAISITYTDKVKPSAPCKIVRVKPDRRARRTAEYAIVCERPK